MRAQEELWRGNCAAAALARVSRASRRMVRVWSNTGAGDLEPGPVIYSTVISCDVLTGQSSRVSQVPSHLSLKVISDRTRRKVPQLD